MNNLDLNYIALFVLAGGVGLAIGWFMRQFVVARLRRALEHDLHEVRRLTGAGGAKRTP